MPDITVNVQKDHIEALVAAKRPMGALVELVWNALDADANQVSIDLETNGLGALDTIRVVDDGTGIPVDDCEKFFGSLGGSWKSIKGKSPGGRSLHGKAGKGRFRAFGLGSRVAWETRVRQNGGTVRYEITGHANSLNKFSRTNPIKESAKDTGTTVTITNFSKNFPSLTDADAPVELVKYLAAYLNEYPGIAVRYNGKLIDPAAAQHRVETFNLGKQPISTGKSISLQLTIIEWVQPVDRELHLCDAKGVSLHHVPVGVAAPGYNFTAYLKSDYFRDLDKTGQLALDELNPDCVSLIGLAKSKLKEYFRKRAAEDAAGLVREWKNTKVYPYEGEPEDVIEQVEREVFDVVAMNIHSYLNDFDEASTTNQRFTFNLVKQALKENPESLQRIFTDVLKLPKEQQDDLASLLEKTSLAAIISASKTVTNRLDFIKGLEALVFDPESKKKLLERDQLHKILAQETWIFGEAFNLSSNEDSLEQVLAKHLEKLGKRTDDGPVRLENGTGGRVDLMLSRSVPSAKADEPEYLVLELKRPAKKIDLEVLGQVKSYALAVAGDERFAHTKTKWVFWAISNEMTKEAQREAKQKNRESGLVYEDAEQQIVVYAKTWGQIVIDAKARLQFFKERLKYEADHASARQYLEKTHAKYLPKLDAAS
ncbi:MAG: ATP-binding protein [Elusimicrobiota bacterium]